MGSREARLGTRPVEQRASGQEREEESAPKDHEILGGADKQVEEQSLRARR